LEQAGCFPEAKIIQQRKGQSKMIWSAVPFGKHEGKTFPEIIVRDPDWFFWMVPKLYGKLADEAEELARKARAIKIPKSPARKWEVEYQYDCDQRFCGFAFVKTGSVLHSRWTTRLPHLDLTWPLRQKRYDKRAGRIMIGEFRRHYFGEYRRLTKDRCEEFFSNDRNFIDI
jgi:hypothetical protein